MNLTDDLNKQREQFLATAPEEAIKVMTTARQELRNSGIEKAALQVGDKAPVISLKATDESTVELYDKLQAGPVILKFFRGDW